MIYERSFGAIRGWWNDQMARTEEMYDDLYGTFTDKRYWYGDYDSDKMEKFRSLYSLPGFRQMMDYQLDRVNDEYYMKNNQLELSDVRDPRKLSATGSSANLNGFFWSRISSNVNRLYRM